MNIGLVNEYFPPFAPGGAEWSVYYLAKELARQGHRVVVITPDYDGEGYQEEEEGVRVYRFPFPAKIAQGQKSVPIRYHANPLFYLYSAFHILRVVRREKLDILHAQNHYSLVGTYLAARLSGLPVFFTLRDTVAICHAALCLLRHDRVPPDCGFRKCLGQCADEFYDLYLGYPSRWRKVKNKVALFWLWLDTGLRRFFLRRVDGIVGVSQGILNLYIQSKVISEERTRCVYNLPPEKSLVSEQAKADWRRKLGLADKQVVLYVGKFSPGKGTRHLVEASDEVVREMAEVVFLFVGKGDLKARRDWIRVLGSLPHGEVLKLYHLADVVAMPSVWPEPLSRVLLEAMTAGRPVVGTRTGGTPEVVLDGVNGFLVERSAPSRLAEALITLLKDEKLREEMGCQGQKLVVEKFNRERSVQSLLDFYREGRR